MPTTVEIAYKHKNSDQLYNHGTWTMYECAEELSEHLDITLDTTTRELTKLIKSKESVDNWDHYQPSANAGALRLAIGMSKVDGVNPIYSVDKYQCSISQNKLNTLLEHGNVLINGVGGYTHYDPEYMVVLSKKEMKPIDQLKNFYHIPSGTKYLNLENDPELEEYTQNTLSTIDVDFSYVVNLRSFSKERLEEVFTEFVSKGGQGLWIYTTGSDLEQLQDYVILASRVGIKKYYFTFNSGISEELHETLVYFKSIGLEIDWREE